MGVEKRLMGQFEIAVVVWGEGLVDRVVVGLETMLGVAVALVSVFVVVVGMVVGMIAGMVVGMFVGMIVEMVVGMVVDKSVVGMDVGRIVVAQMTFGCIV